MSSFADLVQYYFFRMLYPGSTQWRGPKRVMSEDYREATSIARRLYTYVYQPQLEAPGITTQR